MKNAGNNPNVIVIDSIDFITSNRHIRRRPMNIGLLKEVEYSKIESIFRDRFADASDLTFTFVGNIDIEKFKPLVENYLGSLPDIDRKEKFNDNNIRFPKGQAKFPFSVAMKVPKNTCFVAYQTVAVYNLKIIVVMSAIDHALGLRYTETIREKEGGTYDVSSRGMLSKSTVSQAMVNMYFDTDPQKADHLVGIIHSEFKKIIDNGPLEEGLNKAKQYFLKSRNENLRENRFWSSVIREYYTTGVDIVTSYDEFVRQLNPKDIQKVANKLFNKSNMVEIIMSSQKN